MIEIFLSYWYIFLLTFFILWIIRNNSKSTEKVKNDLDWEKVRQNAFNTYGNYCSTCGIIEDLQVHHKIPRSLGGTNHISNLIVLCKNCHEEEHGYKFVDSQINKKRITSSKMQKINSAIINNEKLTIIYNNTFKREIVKREIKPLELYKLNYLTKTGKTGYHWTVRSYCYLRNGERNFQIRKIKRVL